MVDLLNKQIKHTGALGVGTVTEQDDKYITVQFASKVSKFAYPAAFEKFLVPVDQKVADTIKSELEAVKASGKKVGSSKAYTPVKRVDGQALTYLVFQGDTYNEERTGQFIWAPKYRKDGRTMHHWDRLMDVGEGNVIFHCSDGDIQAISRVKASFDESARLDHTTGDWTNWEKDGRRVDCDYHVLKTPLEHTWIKFLSTVMLSTLHLIRMEITTWGICLILIRV